MKLPSRTAISPEEINGTVVMTIRENEFGDCVDVEKKTSAKGKKYEVYTLYVRFDGNNRIIAHLMRGDFDDCSDFYGEDTTEWIGKRINVRIVEKDKYKNFVLQHVDEKVV